MCHQQETKGKCDALGSDGSGETLAFFVGGCECSSDASTAWEERAEYGVEHGEELSDTEPDIEPDSTSL